MKNRELYEEDIIKVALRGYSFSVLTNGEIAECSVGNCKDCIFDVNGSAGLSACQPLKVAWLDAEFEDVDWKRVEIDTKVLVSDDGKHWYRKYYAGCVISDEGTPICLVYPNGYTSWSFGMQDRENKLRTYKYIKLAEGFNYDK